MEPETFDSIFNKYVLKKIRKIIKFELESQPNIEKEGHSRLYEERKEIMVKLFICNLEDFFKKDSPKKSFKSNMALMDPSFYKCLLANTIETVYFVLNI